GRLWKGTRSGAAAVVISRRPFHPGPLGAHKTTSRLAYDLAREEARMHDADETLLLGGDQVYEGAVSNVFVVKDGEVRTPPLALGILPGIVRRRVLELGEQLGIPIRETAVGRDDLARADEIFLTNSIQEVVPVGRCGERELPDRKVGERLREAYRA